MKNYEMKNIRNILLVGGSGSGKTTLVEHMLNKAKATSRIGKIDEGNTVMDFDPEEIEKKMSISLSIGHLDWKNARVNMIDAPSYPDFYGEQIAGFTAAETALMVVNGAAGFDVSLELPLELMAKNPAIAKAIIVNRLDNEHADFQKAIDMIQENSEIIPAPLIIPIGKENTFNGVVDIVKGKAFVDGKVTAIPDDMADFVEESRMKLMEAVAEADDTLLEKYFEEGELTDEELASGIKVGINKGIVVPVFATSATKDVGVETLLDAIIDYLPSPADRPEVPADFNGEIKKIKASADGELYAYIFKSFADPNIGDIAYVKVLSGTLRSGMDVLIPEKDGKDKIGAVSYVQGKNRTDTTELRAGEIGGLVKLKLARGMNSIVPTNAKYCFPSPKLPSPIYWQRIRAANQSDEDKIGAALTRLLDEDPTVRLELNTETHEQILSGAGEQQINLVVKNLMKRFKVEAVLETPRIPYRETITGNADERYRHKKQSGGRGQYGEVYFRLKPSERGKNYEFIDSIVGGRIPSKFVPAIEKGVVETMDRGVIAGYKVVDISVEVYDGSYHDVDSSEMAFKIAASQCLKACFAKANPILLEPIHTVKIVIPNEYMGDVMGDISTRRGKILGMEQSGKKQILNAQLPLAELFSYYPALKSLTQGRGRFEQEFSHYERVPYEVAEKVIAEYKEQD